MSTYSSQFFVPSQVAIETPKATIGLGFDLPAEVLAATTRPAPMVGLGISGDLLLVRVRRALGRRPPPMLAPRRPPGRLQVVDSPATESAPIHTPSQSLRGFADAMPPTPTLKCSPAFPRAVGLGIDLLGLDALSFQGSACYPVATGVGLGFGLPCFDGAELINSLESQSTSQEGIVVTLSFLDAAATWTSPTTSIMGAPDICVHRKPSRSLYALGFEADEPAEPPHTSPTYEDPSLGFGSPFWASTLVPCEGYTIPMTHPYPNSCATDV